MGEVYDESLSAEQLSSLNGESFPVSMLFVKENEIVPPDSLRLVKPEEEHEGFTGNAGMTLERWDLPLARSAALRCRLQLWQSRGGAGASAARGSHESSEQSRVRSTANSMRPIC